MINDLFIPAYANPAGSPIRELFPLPEQARDDFICRWISLPGAIRRGRYEPGRGTRVRGTGSQVTRGEYKVRAEAMADTLDATLGDRVRPEAVSMRLSFAAPDVSEIREGVARLSRAFDSSTSNISVES